MNLAVHETTAASIDWSSEYRGGPSIPLPSRIVFAADTLMDEAVTLCPAWNRPDAVHRWIGGRSRLRSGFPRQAGGHLCVNP